MSFVLITVILAVGLEWEPDDGNLLILQYRILFRDQLGRECVFDPSCSHYAEEALEAEGLIPGFSIALERWTRCHGHALSRGDYVITSEGRAIDPLGLEKEITCWGKLLLPF